MTCSCGTPTAHEIARRATSDGIVLLFWSDGLVTGRVGHYLRGIGAKRLAEGASIALREEVCILTREEIASRFRAYHEAGKRLGVASPADYRKATAPPVPAPGAFAGVWQRTREHIANCRRINCKECL